MPLDRQRRGPRRHLLQPSQGGRRVPAGNRGVRREALHGDLDRACQRPPLRRAAAHRHDAAGELHPPAARGRRPRAGHGRTTPTSPSSWAATSATCSSSTTSHVVVLIGDVAGKGVRAAGMTETVRSTVRAFAAIDPSPAFILGKTNELLLRYDPDEPHVTAFLRRARPPHRPSELRQRRPPRARASRRLHVPAARGGLRAAPWLLRAPLHGMPTRCSPSRTTSCSTPTASPRPAAAASCSASSACSRSSRGLRGRSAQEVAEGVRDAALDVCRAAARRPAGGRPATGLSPAPNQWAASPNLAARLQPHTATDRGSRRHSVAATPSFPPQGHVTITRPSLSTHIRSDVNRSSLAPSRSPSVVEQRQVTCRPRRVAAALHAVLLC